MTRTGWILLLLTGVFGSSALKATSYTFTTFPLSGLKDPGAVGAGINDAGAIVGDYTPPNGSPSGSHAFLYKQGKYTTITGPNASLTFAAGINNAGTVVGSYQVGDSSVYGYVFQNGKLTTVAVPGASQTWLTGINNLGTIVGYTLNSQGTVEQGLIDQNGVIRVFALPGPLTNLHGLKWAAPAGVNDSGTILLSGLPYFGLDNDFYNNGVLTQFGVKGASYSVAVSIDNQDQVLVNAGEFLGPLTGSVYQNGMLTPIDVPGAVPGSVNADAFSAGGLVLGSFEDVATNETEQFIATPSASPEPEPLWMVGLGLAAFCVRQSVTGKPKAVKSRSACS